MRVVFMGSADFAVPSLDALYQNGYQISGVITQPDREKGRGKKLAATPVKILAESLGLAVFQPEKVNSPESIETIRAMQPDLLVVVAFGQILKEDLLNLAPLGAVNVHGSLLPKYRGAAPIHWAIVNGEKETGVTTMYLDKGMDSGDIIYQKKTEIRETDDVGSLHDRLMEMGASLLLETLEDIGKGVASRVPQDETLVTYASLLKKEHELISWQRNARDVFNHIRGFSPWPGAYTLWNGQRLKLYQAQYLELTSDLKPGAILTVDIDGVVVQAINGAVKILELQPEGKPRMTAGAFARGHRLKAGDSFEE